MFSENAFSTIERMQILFYFKHILNMIKVKIYQRIPAPVSSTLEAKTECWLRIELAEWKHVVIIEIYNRGSPYEQRLSNTELYVYGSTPTENRQLCDIIVDGGFDYLKRVCKEPLFGKGVELYQPRTGQERIINIHEVIVHGN